MARYGREPEREVADEPDIYNRQPQAPTTTVPAPTTPGGVPVAPAPSGPGGRAPSAAPSRLLAEPLSGIDVGRLGTARSPAQFLAANIGAAERRAGRLAERVGGSMERLAREGAAVPGAREAIDTADLTARAQQDLARLSALTSPAGLSAISGGSPWEAYLLGRSPGLQSATDVLRSRYGGILSWLAGGAQPGAQPGAPVATTTRPAVAEPGTVRPAPVPTAPPTRGGQVTRIEERELERDRRRRPGTEVL